MTDALPLPLPEDLVQMHREFTELRRVWWGDMPMDHPHRQAILVLKDRINSHPYWALVPDAHAARMALKATLPADVSSKS